MSTIKEEDSSWIDEYQTSELKEDFGFKYEEEIPLSYNFSSHKVETLSDHISAEIFENYDKTQIKVVDLFPNNRMGLTGFLIENCFSSDECQLMIKAMETVGLDFKLSGNRHCFRKSIMDEKLSEILFERSRDFLPQSYKVSGIDRPLQGLNPMIRYIKYLHKKFGHKFGPHVDAANHSNNCKSFFTFMVYLNDDFEGGETVFLEKGFQARIKPKTGTVCVFEQDVRQLLHEGLEVEGDENCKKYILRSDVMYRP
ncbi:oxidoreductase [Naegleria gruberi]|uniref:Oxidoreductase n=1 Tax=Naegleria gruberi TaxID=5762 RepID=D2VKQ7_NAEGR|nr:oxidoreductase [Naegleria gruberi]EFC42735.1 oxidoreductase [Naegleria gruberi]|eukprot:XP_002675479.1 oxidoreductase [Naegleria gruberi]